MRAHRNILATLAVTVGCGVACTTTATGRKQLLLMPEDEVAAMGRQAFLSIKREEPIERSPTTNDYVRCVADRLLDAIGTEGARWEVVVFEDPAANAFALPGGKIGVYTGLFEIARNQDELAAVLAHEIAHVTQRHGNERVSQAFVAQGGLTAASLALGGEGGADRDLVLAALGIGAEVGVLMPFGRAQESEADVVGLDYMARAGFDPRGAVSLWRNMARVAGDSPPQFLSTHPSHETRLEDLQARMPAALAASRAARARGESPQCARERISMGAKP